MTSVLQRLRKRNAHPVKIGDEEILVRALTLSEARAADKLPENERVLFAIGTGLLNDAKEPEYPRLSGESDLEFAKRIEPNLEELGLDVLAAVYQSIEKASKPGSIDALKKSS